MKITILGSCLSGMALALRLAHSRHDVEICTPEPNLNTRNRGYLFNSVTYQTLQSLGLNLKNWVTPIRGGRAYTCSDQSQPETGDYLFSVDSVHLHNAIQERLGEDLFRFNTRFSHFKPKAGYHIKSAKFLDGTESWADLFVGADGAQSVVRKAQVPGPALSMVQTIQISGISRVADAESILKGMALAYRIPQIVGELVIFPIDHQTVSWRMQLDARSQHMAQMVTSADERRFVSNLGRRWAKKFRPIFDEHAITEIESAKCSDRRLPHLFHKDNVVLIGKAAHPTLPDLLSGIDSDLEDALLLGDLLDEYEKGHFASLDICLTEFIRQRRPLLNSRIRKARASQNRILTAT